MWVAYFSLLRRSALEAEKDILPVSSDSLQYFNRPKGFLLPDCMVVLSSIPGFTQSLVFPVEQGNHIGSVGYHDQSWLDCEPKRNPT